MLLQTFAFRWGCCYKPLLFSRPISLYQRRSANFAPTFSGPAHFFFQFRVHAVLVAFSIMPISGCKCQGQSCTGFSGSQLSILTQLIISRWVREPDAVRHVTFTHCNLPTSNCTNSNIIAALPILAWRAEDNRPRGDLMSRAVVQDARSL